MTRSNAPVANFEARFAIEIGADDEIALRGLRDVEARAEVEDTRVYAKFTNSESPSATSPPAASGRLGDGEEG
jgi:hypothetical protein